MDYFERAAAGWDAQPQRVRLMRAIGEAMVREAQPTADMKVLDYGCGTGLVGLYLLPHVAAVTGADNSPAMLEVLRGKIAQSGCATMHAVHLDLEHEAAPPERYHLIVSGMALHHIADVPRVLAAFHEMLLPGGLVCLADLDTEPGTFHSAEATGSVHHLGFDRAALGDQLRQAGFVAVHASSVVTFPKPSADGVMGQFSIFLLCGHRGA
jgi:cyclopropane fatty-acyl-phospholipid synthase-like methyltransferase